MKSLIQVISACFHSDLREIVSRGIAYQDCFYCGDLGNVWVDTEEGFVSQSLLSAVCKRKKRWLTVGGNMGSWFDLYTWLVGII